MDHQPIYARHWRLNAQRQTCLIKVHRGHFMIIVDGAPSQLLLTPSPALKYSPPSHLSHSCLLCVCDAEMTNSPVDKEEDTCLLIRSAWHSDLNYDGCSFRGKPKTWRIMRCPLQCPLLIPCPSHSAIYQCGGGEKRKRNVPLSIIFWAKGK